MFRRVFMGTVAALFFSTTFVLNRSMSLTGGHWVWSASLRFGYMLVFLTMLLLFTKGYRALLEVIEVFYRNWLFWIISGSIGFGVFYSMICFSSNYSAGWIVATTWETTIIATPIVLLFFGRKVPRSGIIFTGLIFIGILLVNLEHAASNTPVNTLLGVLPVLIAAFAYPIGNQMVWEARKGENSLIPHIKHPILENGFARVLLLTIGSIPFWICLLIFTSPPPPSSGQIVSTAVVALCSGVIATTIFLYARHLCQHPFEIAAVDATQSMEVVFTLLGEILFLHGVFPGWMGIAGISLTIIGLIAYVIMQNSTRHSSQITGNINS